MKMANENLGAAERIIQSVLQYTDHLVHNRPGVVIPDARHRIAVRWEPVTHRVQNDEKVVFTQTKQGKKTVEVRVGVLKDNGQILEGGRPVGRYQEAGTIFPEVAAWMYRQVADVWKLDNEFAARWASYAFVREHRDLKVVLAAFMLVQARKGDPVMENGKVIFHDDDFRDVGEAMFLLRSDKGDFNPKLLLRVHELLTLPAVAEINRELGFGRSARAPFLGRWEKAVEKYLTYREENPNQLKGLLKAGFRGQLRELVRKTRYKPENAKFYEALRWKQKQAEDGHRALALDMKLSKAETWEGLKEAAICKKIVKDKPGFKRLVGMIPESVGLTRAIMAAAIEAGCLSDKDLIIATPTLEELGLLQVQDVKERWERAVREAEDQRAANIALRVKSKETKEKLADAADNAVKAAVAEVVKGLRIYFMVDISGSMRDAIETGKKFLTTFLGGIPAEQTHISVFSTTGREIVLKHASAAGVQNAFRGIDAGGGTDYGAGVRVLQKHKPKGDEDVVFVFVGDEEASAFDDAVRQSGLNPLAFIFIKVRNSPGYSAVQSTARNLGIPCIMVDEQTFADPYAIPRTIRNLIAATPVGQAPGKVVQRKTLVDEILETEILKKPAWAA
jgi:hypothetical protein